MKLSMSAALVMVIGLGSEVHAGCASPTCPGDQQEQLRDVTLQRRIENALKDLEVFNARAFKPDNVQATESTLERMIENALKDLDNATTRTLKADPERSNELLRKSGIDR
jgi:hypothetical protein